MNARTERNGRKRLSAARLAAAGGLLLALALVLGGILPAYTEGSYLQPHLFEGHASTLEPAEPVPQGELVQAFVGGELRAETTTDAGGHYYFAVPGKTGEHGSATVTFKVAGVVAEETAIWRAGEISKPFDLTIEALPVYEFDLSMAVSPAGAGTATDVSAASPYLEGATVSIKAEAATGYKFSHWTSEPDVDFANANAAQTTITMPAENVTVTAHFQEAPEPETYTLTLAASPFMGGTVTDVTASPPYEAGQVVTIQAAAASGYQFSHWTAEEGTLGNPNAATTDFTMPGLNVTVTATFLVEPVGPGCFIATAAYGTPAAQEIGVLRDFRDTVLLPNRVGADFVSFYYKASPPIADFISQHEALRAAVRMGLNPIVAALNWSYSLWSEDG